jgi:GT2 family glycosyltransferase
MRRIATLLTCHNRKSKTLACLAALYKNSIPSGYSLDVFLVDDGSTDGTGSAVFEKYPDVNIIHGDGNLYWAGGMRLAWATAAAQKFDYYLWLNDDTNVYSSALESLISSAQQTQNNSIICATVCSKVSGEITYGGKLRQQKNLHIPNTKLQECELINGNCVLIPENVFHRVGNIDEKFTHAIGDWDYGLRAIKSGYRCYVAPSILGTCESNTSLPKWCLPEIPFRQRIKALYSPLASAQPVPYFIYVSRHFGYFSAIKQFLAMHVRVIFPSLWKYRRG